MKMKNSVKLIFASALLLTVAACSKGVDPQGMGKSPVRFNIGVDLTKATLINSADESSFTTEGFKVIAYEGTSTERLMNKEVVAINDGTWKPATDYYWKKNTEMTFYAFYPQALATSLDGKTTNAGIAAFTYSPLESGITADIKGQTDYMLATYSGTGNNGVAELTFKHPTGAVQFVVGSIDASVTAINKVTISGCYSVGTCTQNIDDRGRLSFSWSDANGSVADDQLYQDNLAVSTFTEGTSIGAPFTLVPQTFGSAAPLTVMIAATVGGKSTTLLATIESGSIISGTVTTYKINFTKETSDKLSFTAELLPWTSNNSYVANVGIKETELHIKNFDDFYAFKSDIESPYGKDYSGYTIYLDELKRDIEIQDVSIYDYYGRLNGATIDGQGNCLENIQFVANEDDTNGTSGLFSTLTSDNVVFQNLIFKICGSYGSGSFIAGTYTGSRIIIDNCTIESTTSTSGSNPLGVLIGTCRGDAVIRDCNLSYGTIVSDNGYYTSCIIGEVDGKINIEIEDCTIDGCSIYSETPDKIYGYFIGHCMNYSEGMTISIENCTAQNNSFSGWPDVSENMYIHTGTGLNFGMEVTAHFNAVAWNNQGADKGLTVTMSGMENNDWAY